MQLALDRGPQAACRADVAFEPRSVRARLDYGWALVEARAYRESLVEFQAALRLDPQAITPSQWDCWGSASLKKHWAA
jgi:hypothetical protein